MGRKRERKSDAGRSQLRHTGEGQLELHLHLVGDHRGVGPFLLAGGEAQEVGHGVRGLVVEQVDGDIAFRGAHDDGSHGPKCLMGLRPGGNAAALAIVRMSRKRYAKLAAHSR